MKQLVIYRSEPEHDCETYGITWEESYHTFFEGEQIGLYAAASCFGPINTTYDSVLSEVLRRLGYEVKVVDCEQ